MKRFATKDNIRVPLSDQTNVVNMKKSGKSNVKVVKNPGRKLNVENKDSKRPKSKSRNAVPKENNKIKKTKPEENVYESQLTNKEGKVLKVVLTDIQAKKGTIQEKSNKLPEEKNYPESTHNTRSRSRSQNRTDGSSTGKPIIRTRRSKSLSEAKIAKETTFPQRSMRPVELGTQREYANEIQKDINFDKEIKVVLTQESPFNKKTTRKYISNTINRKTGTNVLNKNNRIYQGNQQNKVQEEKDKNTSERRTDECFNKDLKIILEDLNQEKNKCLKQKEIINKRIFKSRSQFCPATVSSERLSDVAEKANSILEDLNQEKNKCLKQKEIENKRIFKSRSQFCPATVSSDRLSDVAEKANSVQKVRVSKRIIRPKSLCSCCTGKAKPTETHLKEGLDAAEKVVRNTNQIDTFGKALKVVLTDFVVEKNMLRRRSKSLCEEKFVNQKIKPNKRNRAISQCFDTENIEDILPKKVGTKKVNLKNQPSKVTFNPGIESGKEIHNLRRLQPKYYMEDSILNCFDDKTKEKSPGSDLKKKDTVPIYKKKLAEEQKNTTQKEDLYEFTDFSPKAKKVAKNRRLHTSSILFDKDTYEILAKLEEKEAKAKKQIERKKKKLEKEKSYGDIVNGIVANVMEKISKNKKNPVTSTTTQNNKVIHINNFEEDLNVIIHSSYKVPSTIKETVPEVPRNVNTRKFEPVINTAIEKPLSVVPKNVTTRNVEQITNTAITTRNPAANWEAQCSNHDNFLNLSDIDPILLQSIGSCDNSVSQKDIDSCFGFDIPSVPLTSTPAKLASKNTIHILNNVVLRRGAGNIDSPVVDFNAKRPNANSTMVQMKSSQRASSPWRPDWVNLRHNPHFISVKANALPRLEQDMVLDHSLVEEFENSCSKTPRNRAETPAKKPSVQQSILNYVDSNIEQENEDLQGSLYDYEAFNSPEKKAAMKDKRRVQKIQRNILGDRKDTVASTPTKRRPLADISNSSEETKEQNTQNFTYFGFDESSEYITTTTPEKHTKNHKNYSEENKEDNVAKPSRFNINTLRSYTKKRGSKEKQVVNFDQNKSISIFEASSEDEAAEVHLFEEPEEMLDNMPPDILEGKRQRRKRLDSCDSDSSECGKKRKKHKKTKLEIEQEKWIKSFNEMCCEVDKEVLELE